jgi:beta-glucuronidase
MIRQNIRLLALVLGLFTGRLSAQPFMTNIPGRHVRSLNGRWQILIDWYDNGANLHVYKDQPPPDKSHFVEYGFTGLALQVPGDWNHALPALNYYEGSVWYKKTMSCIVKPGKRTFLYFGAANYKTDVYLNGELLGSHEGGFTPFQFEVTGKLHTGKNKLILRVNNSRVRDGIPALGFDWWNYGGITRDVSLIETPEDFVKDYFLQLKKGSMDEVEGWVRLDGSRRPETMTMSIPEAGIQRVLVCDTSGYAKISFKAPLRLWSPADPKLYRVIFATGYDTIREDIGFRSIEVRGTQIILNGKPIFLRGVNFHEEIGAAMRRAVSEADARELLTRAKALGCNFVRTAHYPQNEYTVRLAEKLGLMLWEEIPVWQDIRFTDTAVFQKAFRMLTEMVTRDKNRCGIVIWSMSNETRPGAPGRTAMIHRLAEYCRQLDPTRLVSSAFNSFSRHGDTVEITDPLSADLDVLGANLYMGWYGAWPGKPGDLTWLSHFDKPLIFTEFGAEAAYGTHGAADSANGWTEEYQAQVYRDNLRMFSKIPFLAGTCPWILVDFRSPFRLNAQYQRGWNRKGLTAPDGGRKKAWYVMKAFYNSFH